MKQELKETVGWILTALLLILGVFLAVGICIVIPAYILSYATYFNSIGNYTASTLVWLITLVYWFFIIHFMRKLQ